MSVYSGQIEAALPRLLARFDTDPISPTRGQGDRSYWAWKCVDFGNGTYQGAANGMARLLVSDMLPDWIAPETVPARILDMFHGARTLRRPDGSMEEAFPWEGSFCVTALVAHDLLTAIELLGERLDKTRRAWCLDVVRPMIGFLLKADETHGFISNHLATASAALYAWLEITGEPVSDRAKFFLDRVLDAQSVEGWYPEYQGADPGYMTLTLTYLADILRRREDAALADSLHRAVRFLIYWVHPDGSFGGHYGSRETRLYHPAGVEFLADRFPEAGALARFMRRSVAEDRCVTLRAVDAPNLVPVFNGYAWASVLAARQGELPSPEDHLPCLERGTWRRKFSKAGLLAAGGPSFYAVVSLHKGGVCYAFFKDGRTLVDTGAVYRHRSGRFYGTQALEENNLVREEGEDIVVESRLTAVRHMLPTPARFLLLRLLNLTVMRIRPVREGVKKLLVRLLITGGKRLPVVNVRRITLGPEPRIEDRLEGPSRIVADLERLEVDTPWRSLHMASSGYWQRGDGDIP